MKEFLELNNSKLNQACKAALQPQENEPKAELDVQIPYCLQLARHQLEHYPVPGPADKFVPELLNHLDRALGRPPEEAQRLLLGDREEGDQDEQLADRLIDQASSSAELAQLLVENLYNALEPYDPELQLPTDPWY